MAIFNSFLYVYQRVARFSSGVDFQSVVTVVPMPCTSACDKWQGHISKKTLSRRLDSLDRLEPGTLVTSRWDEAETYLSTPKNLK